MVDLGERVVNDLGWTIMGVVDFNDNGQVLVNGFDLNHWTAAIIEPLTPGDLDGDDVVDGTDLGILLSSWGVCQCPADLDADGHVDGTDLGILLGMWE